MTKIVIIGGGLAGLSSAVYLSLAGAQVELHEAAPKLGGRAYSFSVNNTIVDNGPHILMGCYHETLKFLRLINAGNGLIFQKNLQINFIDKIKGLITLQAPEIPYPFNLIAAMLNYNAITFFDRINLIWLFAKIFFTNPSKFEDISVYQWLKANRQSENTIKALWEILTVGTLNTSTDKASAEIFVGILKQMFFSGKKSSTVILPALGLSELYCTAARYFLESRGSKIILSSRLQNLCIKNNKVISLIINDKERNDFDAVILAIPPFALEKIIPDNFIDQLHLADFCYSPILAVHLWLSKNLFTKKFFGLIDSPIHWVFNNDKHISIVISSADKLISKNKDEIVSLVVNELEQYFPFFSRDQILKSLVIKEKRATFIPDKNILKKRAHASSSVENLFFAGDWTNTDLPATIESAVKSGRLAAEAALK